jgi:sialic acid synthase SpsE
LFTKSVVARVDLVAGTKLAREHLAAKKPGTGIPAARLDALIGRRLRRAVAADALLSESDLEELP